MAASNLTAARLRELLHYDHDTGVFTWLITRNSRGGPIKPGDLAGCTSVRGVLIIGIDGRNYMAHRLAFLMMTGEWPEHTIDHIDGVPSNNKWSNLRSVTQSVNLQNQRRARSDSKSGVLGVSRKRKRWVAMIRVDGVQTYLGTFDTPEEASARYLLAKRLHHAGCTI